MGDGKRLELKEIPTHTTVKAIITGYIAYGILIWVLAMFMQNY